MDGVSPGDDPKPLSQTAPARQRLDASRPNLGTNSALAVLKGVISGPNGGRFWAPYAIFVAAALLIAILNTTSEWLEAARDGRALPAWEPFVWEFSSFLVNLAITPFVALAAWRFPFRREAPLRTGLIHFLLTVPYSLVHVAGMVGLRKLAYAAAGLPNHYDFSHGVLPLVLLYEWRKDVLTYGLTLALFWGARLIAERRDARAAPQSVMSTRLEIREDGRTLFLAPSEIVWIEAAGNYVEIHTAAKSHLVRGTIAAFETRLSASGLVRVHRSRLVNTARIRALKPTPSGDVEITFDDGRSVTGSRRYRRALPA